MKRYAVLAGALAAMLVAGGKAVSATEVDPNPINRYPAYSSPFRGNDAQSSGVRLERRAPSAHRHSGPQQPAPRYDRASGIGSGGL